MLHNFDRSPLVETVPSLAEPRVYRLSKTRLAGLLREFSIHSLGTGIASRLPHLPSFSMGAGVSDLGPHSSIARTLTHQATCAAPYQLSYKDESHGHFRHPANKLLTLKRLLFLTTGGHPCHVASGLRTAKRTEHLTQVCPPSPYYITEVQIHSWPHTLSSRASLSVSSLWCFCPASDEGHSACVSLLPATCQPFSLYQLKD